MKKAETEIRGQFKQYNDTLARKKKEESEALTKWGETLISQIKNHVTEQKKLLDQHFDNQKRFLDDEQKKFLAHPVVQEKKNDKEQIDRLIDACKALKLNLDILHRYDQPIAYMRVMKEEELVLKSPDETSTKQPQENESQNRTTEDNNNSTGNTASGSGRPSLRPASASGRPPSRQIAENPTEPVPSATGNDASNSDGKSGADMIDKCPICFMIFPKSMELIDRRLHVNEHYADD